MKSHKATERKRQPTATAGAALFVEKSGFIIFLSAGLQPVAEQV
jgi:hypothetical protein